MLAAKKQLGTHEANPVTPGGIQSFELGRVSHVDHDLHTFAAGGHRGQRQISFRYHPTRSKRLLTRGEVGRGPRVG